MGLLEGKVAIVTGGTEGIGYETSVRFAEEGAIVYACARHEKIFDNPLINYHYCDVTDERSVKELYEDVIKGHGKIDCLVANAGITCDALTVKMTNDMFESVINTNLKGVFNIVKMVGPFMEENGGGSIVTIGSVVGEYGNIGQVNYAASKAGITAMSKSWAKEFSRKGVPVRVNTIAPGYTMTKMMNSVPQKLLDKFSQQTMLKRLGKPKEIANAIVFLASDLSSYITGTVLSVDGGMRL